VTSNEDNTAVRTSTRILDAAERMVQTRGFNGFSYADVAAELEITKAALHYHFSGKAELGTALIARYGSRFMAALQALDETSGTALAKLDGYIELYAGVLSQQKMCLCGMLAAEYQTLPDPMRSRVTTFFDENADWLERVLNQGRAEGSLTFQPVQGHRSDDHQRPGGRHARRQALRRHRELPGDSRRPDVRPARQPAHQPGGRAPAGVKLSRQRPH